MNYLSRDQQIQIIACLTEGQSIAPLSALPAFTAIRSCASASASVAGAPNCMTA